MFSGIIEASEPILQVNRGEQSLRIVVKYPYLFDKLKSGDSIAVNGVCLTVERFSIEGGIEFTVGAETLQIVNWTHENLKDQIVNLERSLAFGDRVHGHLVSGHVETIAQLVERRELGESLYLKFEIVNRHTSSEARNWRPFIWNKGSIAVNGVSLTVNEVSDGTVAGSHYFLFSVCLIPETIKRTNLGEINIGDFVNIETDYLSKVLFQTYRGGATRGPEQIKQS